MSLAMGRQPRHLAAITFTELAAAELGHRIVACLRSKTHRSTPFDTLGDSLRVLAKIVSTLEHQTLARARPFLLGHVRSGIPVQQASRKWGHLTVLMRGGRRSLSPDVLGRLTAARVGQANDDQGRDYESRHHPRQYRQG
jgi:hypothetical protein